MAWKGALCAILVGMYATGRLEFSMQDAALVVLLLLSLLWLIGMNSDVDVAIARMDTTLDAALARVDDSLLKIDRHIERLELMIKEMEEATDWRTEHWHSLE